MNKMGIFNTFPFELVLEKLENTDFNTMTKSANDYVTSLDLALEAIILNWIHTVSENPYIISEESSPLAISNASRWVIDPLDGTLNYIQHLPYYGVQLAEFENDRVKNALLLTPKLNRLVLLTNFTGLSFYQITSANELIPVACQSPAVSSGITFGDFSNSNPDSKTFQAHLMELCAARHKVRIYGSSACDFMLLANRISGMHILFSKRPWELATGMSIAEASGLTVLTLHIKTNSYEGPLQVAGNEYYVNELLKLLSTDQIEFYISEKKEP